MTLLVFRFSKLSFEKAHIGKKKVLLISFHLVILIVSYGLFMMFHNSEPLSANDLKACPKHPTKTFAFEVFKSFT